MLVLQIKQGGYSERLVPARMALKAVIILVSTWNAVTTCTNYHIYLTSKHLKMWRNTQNINAEGYEGLFFRTTWGNFLECPAFFRIMKIFNILKCAFFVHPNFFRQPLDWCTLRGRTVALLAGEPTMVGTAPAVTRPSTNATNPTPTISSTWIPWRSASSSATWVPNFSFASPLLPVCYLQFPLFYCFYWR